jgi:hypothetical protein
VFIKRLLLLLIFFGVVAVPVRSTAQSDERQRLQLEETTDRQLLSITTTDEAVLVAAGTYLLRFTPGTTMRDTQLQLNGTIRALVANTDHAFALTANHIIVINLQNFQVVHEIAGGGEEIVLHRDHLLLLNADAGVRQYRIEHDGHLQLQRDLATMNRVKSAAVLDDGTVLIVDQAAGFEIFVPQLTPMMSALLPSMSAERLLVQGDVVLALDGHRLQLLDVSTRSTPQPIGHYAPLHDARHAATFGSFVLVADASDGLKVYHEDMTYLSGDIRNSAQYVAVDPSGQWVVSSQRDVVVIYDARVLPNLERRTTLPVWDTPGRISFARDGLALVAVGDGGLAVIDLAQQTILAGLPFSGPVMHVLPHPQLDLWYVLLGDGRLLTLRFDRSRGQVDTIFSEFDAPGQPSMLALQDERLVVSAGRAGALILDISNPGQPQFELNIAALESVQSVHFSAGQLVLHDGMWLRGLEATGSGFGQTFVATLAEPGWVASSERELLLGGGVSLARWQPTQAGWEATTTYRAPQAFSDMAFAGDNVILAGTDGQLHALNIMQPAQPRLVATYATNIPLTELAMLANGAQLEAILREGTTAVHRFPLTDSAAEPGVLYRVPAPRQRFNQTDDTQTLSATSSTLDVTSQLSTSEGRFIGTRDGQLLRQPDTASSPTGMIDGLDTPILGIASTHDQTLLLSLGDAGLAWVDVESESIIRRAEDVTALQASLDDSGEWLAVATGRCGLAMYAVDDLTLFALAQDGTVSDVRFVDAQTVEAMVDGYPAKYAFDTTATTQVLPSFSVQLQSPTATALRWQSAADGCVPIEHEVLINGNVVDRTTATTYPRASLPTTQFSWQVIAVDPFGNRNPSAEQLVEVDTAGWLSIAQQYQPLPRRSDTSVITSNNLPWYLLGGVLVLSGVGGLWGLYRLWQVRGEF